MVTHLRLDRGVNGGVGFSRDLSLREWRERWHQDKPYTESGKLIHGGPCLQAEATVNRNGKTDLRCKCTEQSCWMQMMRRCAAAAAGLAAPSPPQSPPCPHRCESVGQTQLLRRRPADGLLREPLTTRCVPDVWRR